MTTQPNERQHIDFGIALLDYFVKRATPIGLQTTYNRVLLQNLAILIHYHKKKKLTDGEVRERQQILEELQDARNCDKEWLLLDLVERALHIIAIHTYLTNPRRDKMFIAAHSLVRNILGFDKNRSTAHARVAVIAVNTLGERNPKIGRGIAKLKTAHRKVIRADYPRNQEAAKHLEITNKYIEEQFYE